MVMITMITEISKISKISKIWSRLESHEQDGGQSSL